MEALGFEMRSEATLRTLTEDVVKTSEIEGEILAPDQVRSSIATRLGLNIGGLPAADRNVDGVVEMTLDATRNYAAPLTEERLFSWHAALFPTGRSGMRRIRVGQWRDDADGPMEVVSGPIGRQRVHYTAPPAECLGDEISRFLEWFQDTQIHGTRTRRRRRPSLVRHHSSLRRRQRTYRAGDRGHGAGPVGREPRAFLQHVRADPRGAQRVLRHP